MWSRLGAEQQTAVTANCQLAPPATETFGTDDEILAALRLKTLTDRRNLLDAVPQRFARALDEASQLLEPKAVKIHLPSATIKDTADKDTADLEAWIAGVRAQVEKQLKDGPVIL